MESPPVLWAKLFILYLNFIMCVHSSFTAWTFFFFFFPIVCFPWSSFLFTLFPFYYTFLCSLAVNSFTLCIQSFLFIRVFGLHGFGYAHLRRIFNIKKIVRFMTWESVIHAFQERSSESRIRMEKLCSFYTVLGLHGAFRNVTVSITEKDLYIYVCSAYFVLFFLVLDVIYPVITFQDGGSLYLSWWRWLLK